MGEKKLTRSREERWLGGVCGGLADYTGLDVTLIRLVMVLGVFFAAATLLVYLFAWVIIPQAGPPASGPAPAPPSA